MRRIFLLLIITVLTVSLSAFFGDFEDNPANLGDRKSGDLILPGFQVSGGFANNNLNLGDMGMFEIGHLLNDSEKELLSSSDLNFSGTGNLNLLSFGFKNWELSSRVYVKGYLGNIDQEFLDLIFNGNDSADYSLNTSALSNTNVYQFTKTSFDWAYWEGLNFAAVPPVMIAGKDSGAFIHGVERVVNYMREMDIYAGIRVNWYKSFGYAKVLESSQEAVSCQDSLYAYNYLKAVYNDPENDDYTGNDAFGFGFGMKMKLPAGWFHISFDDIGTTLKYDELVSNSYYNYNLDYLDMLDEDHEGIDESEEIEEEPYLEDIDVDLGTTVSWGVDYYLGKGFTVTAKYLNCAYELDGFFLGTTYRPVNWLPLKLTYGSGDVDQYKFKFGFDTESFEIMFGLNNYNGVFNGTKGFGADLGIMFKF